MPKFSIVAKLCLVTVMAICNVALAAGPPPARKATAIPPAIGAACMNGRLLSHAAYLPTTTDTTARCGQMLSTDTLLKVHRWAST